jgi:hypothetical protein
VPLGSLRRVEGDREIHLFPPTDFRNQRDSLTQATTCPLWIHKTKFSNASVYCWQIFAVLSSLHPLLLAVRVSIFPSSLAWPLFLSISSEGLSGLWPYFLATNNGLGQRSEQNAHFRGFECKFLLYTKLRSLLCLYLLSQVASCNSQLILAQPQHPNISHSFPWNFRRCSSLFSHGHVL